MKTFKFSLVLRTRENTDFFITLDDNIYGIHSKRVNILYIPAGTCRLYNVALPSMKSWRLYNFPLTSMLVGLSSRSI